MGCFSMSGGGGRLWYPSGPKINSSSDGPSWPVQTDSKNPDPKHFEITGHTVNGEYVILEVVYPNCTNYEGKKLLVFKGHTVKSLLLLKEMDPHFLEDGFSCIARFAPTDEGLAEAGRFIGLE